MKRKDANLFKSRVDNETFCAEGMTVVIAARRLIKMRPAAPSAWCREGEKAPVLYGAFNYGLPRPRSPLGHCSAVVDRHGRISPRGLNSGSVAYILKQAARRAGMRLKAWSGTLSRAGCVTECASNGVPEYVIMRQMGHTSRHVALACPRAFCAGSDLQQESPASFACSQSFLTPLPAAIGLKTASVLPITPSGSETERAVIKEVFWC